MSKCLWIGIFTNYIFYEIFLWVIPIKYGLIIVHYEEMARIMKIFLFIKILLYSV